MTDRFEHAFYQTPWHRVLPLGPHCIQPYVWSGRRDASLGPRLHRLAAVTKLAVRRTLALGGLAAPDEAAADSRYARARYN